MQLAIIGTKEEIIEIMKHIENMQIVQKTERLLRCEFDSCTESQNELSFDELTYFNKQSSV